MADKRAAALLRIPIHRCRIRFDEFSALRHGDVVIVRTFVGCVLSCNHTKNYLRASPAIRVLSF